MAMPGRNLCNDKYRYGFNGKEKDNKDGAVQYDYGFRIYDPRIGRFLSVDPLSSKFAMLTPYQFASNTPISAIDIDGKEAEVIVDKKAKEVYVNLKFSTDEALKTALQAFNITTDDIKKAGFEYYFKPSKDGKTPAVNDILQKTGITFNDLQQKLGGEIASGGDGYFLVDMKSSGCYKVFYSISLDEKLGKKKDPTVFKLDKQVPGVPYNEQDNKGVHLVVDNNVASKSGHEFGHQTGLPDYTEDLTQVPFTNGTVTLKYKHPLGGTGEITVSDLMDKRGTARVLSSESVVRAISEAIKTAESLPQNRITVLTGGADNPNPISPNEKERTKAKYHPVKQIIKKTDTP